MLTVDGKYGAQTRTAVTGIQKEAKMSADGVVGLGTWAIPGAIGRRRTGQLVRRTRPRHQQLNSTVAGLLTLQGRQNHQEVRLMG